MSSNPTPRWVLFLISGACALPIALIAYIQYFQTPLLAKREFLFAGILWVVIAVGVFFLVTRVIQNRFREMPRRTKAAWLGISAAAGLFLVLVTIQPDYVYATLPRHTLEVKLPSGNGDRLVTLQWLTSDIGDTAFSALQLEGDWKRAEGGLTHSGSDAASFRWVGRTGDNIKLVLGGIEDPDSVFVTVDGVPLAAAAGKTDTGAIVFDLAFSRDWLGSALIVFATWFTAAFLFLVVTLILTRIQLQPGREPEKAVGRSWLFFTTPMLAVWGIYLLTFFPAVMTPDSIRQWEQVITRQFNDAIPVVHTLLIILLTKLWFSPAVAIMVQIAALAFTVAWGIRILLEAGLPRWGGWVLTALFALSSVNGNMVVTLWKDIPYSICLFLLSLMILKIVFTRGDWLASRWNWLWLGFACLGIAVFRLNGLPIPLVTLATLLIIYRNRWKPLAGSIALFLALLLLIQGPYYNYLKVDRNPGFKQQVLLHHIAAHVVNGAELTPREEALAYGITPKEDWVYDCCTYLPNWQVPSYSEPRFTEKAGDIRKLFIDLSIKEPNVEVRHLVCVSSLVWEIPNHCKLQVDSSLPAGEPSWIEPNNLGVRENSRLPILINFLTRVKAVAGESPWDIIFYTPAVFLYLSIYCVSIFVYRKRKAIFYLFLLPAVLQSGVMLLVNVTRAFRYQYGVYLVGLFSIGLLILAFLEPEYKRNLSGEEAPQRDAP